MRVTRYSTKPTTGSLPGRARWGRRIASVLAAGTVAMGALATVVGSLTPLSAEAASLTGWAHTRWGSGEIPFLFHDKD